MPDEGDGRNTPEVLEGASLRRMSGLSSNSAYLYVNIDHPAWKAVGPRDLYVSVEVLDDRFGRVGLQYDKATGTSDISSRYSSAAGGLLLTGLTRKWRTGYFFLPSARLGAGQNFGADFRLQSGSGIGVRRLVVSATRPADFNTFSGLDPSTLASLRAQRGPRAQQMEWTIGSDPVQADAQLYSALGVSSVESYVHWNSVEAKRNQWDWSRWDKQVGILKAAQLKWVPFLIAGTAYGTPLWFQNSSSSQVYKCLEHGQPSRVQSLWSPALRPAIDRFFQAFAAKYGKSGVIESLLLGVSGVYGESIYPAGPEGGWTAELTGSYHNHAGWWAGDSYAKNAFRAAMKAKYKTLAALNRAWGVKGFGWNEVQPFLPDKAPSDRARADFVEWYQDEMTAWAVFWVRTARKYFPKTPIYLCTGGDGDPMLGADFSAQAKAIAPFGAGVRITNEGSDYSANWSLTREVATATRLYKTYCGFEPASEVSASGVVGRIYNATASGARQLHDYSPNTFNDVTALQNTRAHVKYLQKRQPVVEAALYLPRETWALEPARMGSVYEFARLARDVIDLDFVTRRSVLDGALKNIKVLCLVEASVLEPPAAAAIEKWVRQGGTLIVFGDAAFATRLYNNASWRGRLLASASTRDVLHPTLAGSAPARWVLNVGGAEDQAWIAGDWFGREGGGEWKDVAGATKRWSGARPKFLIPTAPGQSVTVQLDAVVPDASVRQRAIKVLWNGQALGEITQEGQQILTWTVPASRVGTALSQLELDVPTWQPAAAGGSADTRALGVAVRQIEVFRNGSASAAPRPATMAWRLDPALLPRRSRRVGAGRTIRLPNLPTSVRTLAALLNGQARWLPEARLSVPDGRVDNRFATRTGQGTLWLDPARAKIELK